MQKKNARENARACDVTDYYKWQNQVRVSGEWY